MRLIVPLLAFAFIVLAAYTSPPDASAKSSETVEASPQWENLQVLPDSLTRDELMGIMDGFKEALGVNCSHCHVREDGEFNFPSDDNSHKEVARDMMRMTWQINNEILPAIEGLGHHGPPMVTCATCHRGSPHPGMEMDHEGMDHEGMNHESMDHSGHDG